MSEARHVPVLLEEVLRVLEPVRCAGRPSLWLDGTLGMGGHAQALLDAAGGQAQLLGLDRDPEALVLAQQTLHRFGTRVHLMHKSFAGLVDEDLAALQPLLGEGAQAGFDGILLDLGVSSFQLDTPERGFSFMREGPLDMRMDPTLEPSAAGWLAAAEEEDLAKILAEYGEERHSRRMAKAVMAARDEGRLRTTRELAQVAEKVLGRPPKGQIHPATRLFQALRLAVNDELQALESGLSSLSKLLVPGGRMAVISFHSLEDRLVKDYFRREATDCICPPGLPECRCGHKAWLKVLTPKPLTAGFDEISENPRSRSAKLRAAQRI
ncbi:MAG TPA: 16S rRNA (cytosine(1402)-N(4))-methyltransferase RsmH [bacterium]|jgi:16S rRNA (cytosine1402-N4)-methyltransferase|nr:16S rRNA (cytosine(1402)-N(4))-methyltransferase RsmH [bacterium]